MMKQGCATPTQSAVELSGITREPKSIQNTHKCTAHSHMHALTHTHTPTRTHTHTPPHTTTHTQTHSHRRTDTGMRGHTLPCSHSHTHTHTHTHSSVIF